ncbi:MAG: hypothetical protein Q9167_000546 [Letrouitia subvulpina]
MAPTRCNPDRQSRPRRFRNDTYPTDGSISDAGELDELSDQPLEDEQDKDYVDDNESDSDSQYSESNDPTTIQPSLSTISDAPVSVSVGQNFDFLSLPPEIRNRVYDFVFVSAHYVGTAYGTLTRQFYRDAIKWRNLCFVKVCRQIYNESSGIFFARNGFEFSYISTLQHFMRSIGIKNRRLITKLRYCHGASRNGRPFKALRYLRSCENLINLEIFGLYYYYNKMLLRKARAFFLTEYSTIGWEKNCDFQLSPLMSFDLSVFEDELRKIKQEQKGTKLYVEPKVFLTTWFDIFTVIAT